MNARNDENGGGGVADRFPVHPPGVPLAIDDLSPRQALEQLYHLRSQLQ